MYAENKHLLIYFLHKNIICLTSRIAVIKEVASEAQGICYVLPSLSEYTQ